MGRSPGAPRAAMGPLARAKPRPREVFLCAVEMLLIWVLGWKLFTLAPPILPSRLLLALPSPATAFSSLGLFGTLCCPIFVAGGSGAQ